MPHYKPEDLGKKVRLAGVRLLGANRIEKYEKELLMTPEDYPTPKETFDNALSELPFRNREILKLRYGLSDCCLTLEEIGQIFKVSHERIRQLESNAIRKLAETIYRNGKFYAMR